MSSVSENTKEKKKFQKAVSHMKLLQAIGKKLGNMIQLFNSANYCCIRSDKPLKELPASSCHAWYEKYAYTYVYVIYIQYMYVYICYAT